ncbi:MAG: tRNA (adenosine(37)-N6)-threonylcarbamoyltransferase complex ATPase subunit type 1 TsaE [Chloroflexi bacterium]|nr:tRNA (adenosine(37)-N6)-threonylcarbamoyltransferase complex ATPase subunit type 1 TsaE [Chloroflexota bacterium]
MTATTSPNNLLRYTQITYSPDATRALGQRLGQLLQAGQVIALHGDLGAGKTVFTQGIAAGLHITRRVTSPTFTLVNEYTASGDRQLIHIDSYRLGDNPSVAAQEAATFGLEELLTTENAIVVIEWAELVATLLPPDHLKIEITSVAQDELTRQITCTALGEQSKALLQALIEAG